MLRPKNSMRSGAKIAGLLIVAAMALTFCACGKTESRPLAGSTDIQDVSVDEISEASASFSENYNESEPVESLRYKLAYLCSDVVPKGNDSESGSETRQVFAMQLDPDEFGEKSFVYDLNAFDESGNELNVVLYSDGTSSANIESDYESEGNIQVYGVVTDIAPEKLTFSVNGDDNDAQDVQVNADRSEIDLKQPIVKAHTLFDLDDELFYVGTIVGGSSTDTATRTGTSFIPVGCDVDAGVNIFTSHIDEMGMVYADGDLKGQPVQCPDGMKGSYKVLVQDGQICVEYGFETKNGEVMTSGQYEQASELLMNATLSVGDRMFLVY